MRKLLHYHALQYGKTNKWILPGLAFLTVLSIMYSVKPVGLTDSISLSATVLFFLMIWVGYGCNQIEDQVSEQIMILRIRSERKFYISQLLFVGMIGVSASIFAFLFTMVQYLLNGAGMFDRSLEVKDVVMGILVCMIYAVAGGMMGALFHSRVMGSGQIAIIAASFFTILTIARSSVIHEIPGMRYVLWIVPPVLEAGGWIGTTEQMLWNGTIQTMFVFALYMVVFSIIRVELLVRNKF